MTEEGLETYLDTFKHGMPPHGGLGIGMERLTMQLLGEDNVRETTPLPERFKQTYSVETEAPGWQVKKEADKRQRGGQNETKMFLMWRKIKRKYLHRVWA